MAGRLGWLTNRHGSMGMTKSSGRCWTPTVRSAVWHCATMSRDRGVDVTEELWWRDEDAEYIRHRSSRYPGATDLEPGWTLEAAADPRRIVLDPDPKSRTGAVRIIGYSACARFVITIVATGAAPAGVTAWKSSGADLRDYEGRDESERDARRPTRAG